MIVYKGTQKGILDLLYLFINKDNIIYLENNNYYKFKSIEFIDIKRHIFNTNTDIEQLDKFINKYIIYTKEKENERIKQNELSKTIEKLKLPIDFGKDTTLYNIECQLKTRYANENLEYIFIAKYLKDEKPKIESFIIELKDSSGFVISEILVDSWKNIIDSDSKIQKGFTENNKIGFDDFKEYQRINTFDVGIITKN